MLQKLIMDTCSIPGRALPNSSLTNLERRIQQLSLAMVATLDQRIDKLRRLAHYKCLELNTSQELLEQRLDDEMSRDEQILLELFRLIDYIDYLQSSL